MDMGFIRFLCQLGLSGLIEINTTHRMLRYCHKQTKLIWKNNHITGKFMKMSANVKSYENDLVWLNEWAQKRRMLLKWSHCRLSNETVVDLAICEGAWEKDFGEVLYTFQSRGQNLNIAKYNCAAVARKILEPKLEEAKMQQQTKIVTPSWCTPLHPHFSSYEARLASFKNWPLEYCQDPAALAEAGFYYTGLLDRVLCFHCDGGLSDWKRTDDPRIEHAKHFDRCYFVKINNFRSLYEKELKDKNWDEEDSVEEPMDMDPDEVPMDIDSEETMLETEVDEVDSSIEVSIKVKDFMSQIFMSTKHKLAKQSDVPAINVTSGNSVPVAQVTSLEPSMAAGNTFYSNTRIGTAVENLNPTALALNNPAGTGSSFDIKESVYSLYKPWISTSVNGSQAVGTEVFRLSLDPQKLPTSILNYVNMHENIIPALDIGIFVNGTAGGLGSLVLGWVPDAADGETYALEDLWRVSCKAISLASTTATTEVLSDIRRMGLYRKVTGDSEPFPGIIGMIDMPATNVNRNDLVNFYIRIMVKLNPQCLLMSPIVTRPSSSLSTQLYSDIPLKAFIKDPIIDLTVTGPARLEQALETTTYADNGWNSGTFAPLPISDDGRKNLIWGVGSTQDANPEAYPVFVDPTLTDSEIKQQLQTSVSYPGGSNTAPITKGMPIYDKIYIAYGTVPTPSGSISREVPGTKTKIDTVYGYTLFRDWLSFTCNYIYVQEGGVGVIAEFVLEGRFDSMTDGSGNKWTVFRTSKRFAQASGSRRDLVFYGNFKNVKSFPTYGCIAPGTQNFAIMQSSLPVGSSVSQDSNAKGALSAWPCDPLMINDNYGFVFYKGGQLALSNGDSNDGTATPQTSILQLSKPVKLNYFVAETSTGKQVALPGAMNALTLSKQGFTMLPTNRSAGVQPPSAAGYGSLLQFLESMLVHPGKPAISFGLKYGKTQVELQACYANGMIMTRGISNVQRVALPVSDCYVSYIMPIADPIDIIPLATNVSSWRPIALQVSQQMWGTAALGIGQGLSSIGSAMYANSARDFNAQMLEKLQELKTKGLLDLEKLKHRVRIYRRFVIAFFAVVCPLGLLPLLFSQSLYCRDREENCFVVYNASAYKPEIVVKKGKYRVRIYRRFSTLVKLVTLTTYLVDKFCFTLNCLFYKIYYKLYYKFIFRNPSLVQQSEVSGLQQMVNNIFSEVGLDSTKLILFSNTFVTIISLSIELFKKGYANTSKYILIPLATSVISLASIVISSENIQVSEVSISAIINFITGKSETTIPTNDIDAANKAIAKDNMCKQIKKKTFAVFKTGPEDWPVEYIKQLAFDHTWELVAKVYKLNDEQVKMLQERVAESVPPAEPQPSTSGTSPTFGPVFSTPDEMAQHYRKQLKTLDLATPKKIQPENRLLKWRISSLKHLKENFTPEQMQLRFNLSATEIDFVKEYDVSQIQLNDKFFAEDVKSLDGNVKLEKQALYGNYIKIIIGVIGFALSPIIAFIMEKYSKLSGVTEIAKVVQSTKYLNEQVQSSADFILNLFNISPETFSIEYHIAEKCKELNLFIQTPIHNLLEEPILLADFQSKIYETEAFLRKIPYDNTSMGLRGLHTAASSHLAAIKRTGQLTGFRQEPRLILFMGSAGTGKTRLAKKLAQTLGEKLYPNIDPLRRVLEITASNNYWPGISGQPIGLLDECDAKKCEDSLLFKNLKGLCSTAVFNCEGAAIEHKHQPAPFKILIGTTNMGIADLRSMLHEHYGDHSMNALWSRMLIYQVERNVQEFGELNILNREASRFDTTGKFRHSIIKECSWSDQYQCPTPSREILLEELVEIVKNRIQFLEEQYKKTQLTAQSNGSKMSICVTGPSGVGKTEYFVKSHFMDYFSARFNLGDKKQPKIIVHDDSHQRGKFNESEYLETYENAPPGSVFLNIENFGSLPLTYSTVLSYLSFKIYPLYKTSMEAIPRRYGVYPAKFSGLLSYFVWFGRTTSWINPHLEISYIFVCSLIIQFICLFASLNLQLVILCINILANIVTYFSLKFYPISICADVIDTDNLTSYFSDIYISNVVSSNKLNILNSIPPQITPNVEVILDCVSNISDFAPSNVMNFLYQNRTNFLVASGNRIYIEPSIALKMVKYIGELKFMKLAESQASHFKILNQFYRICQASGICVNLVVTLGNKKYSIFGNDLYVADDVVDNSCITTEGLIFDGVPLTWKDIASVQVGSTTLQEVTNGSDLDYVKLKRLVLSISNEQVNEIKTAYYEAQVTHMKQVSTAMWNEFMDFFKNTITGKIVAGLIVVLAAYGIGKCLFGESKQSVNKQGKRKIGSRKKKTNYETDQERQNRELSATSSETDSDEEDAPRQQGNKRGAKKKAKPRGFESDDYTRRSPQSLSKNENLSSQVKVSRQGVENIPDLNGMTGIGPAQQVAEKCMKNLVQIYAIPTHMSDQIVQSLTPDEINTFTRNYAMVIKDDILATVGHMGEIAKHGFNHYIMCDELTGDVKYGKCEILKLYKNRDLALMQCPAIKGKFKSIYSKLSRTFYTAPSDGNVLFARYGPMNQKGTKNKEFHSAYMTLFTDETKIEDATGETLIISKFIYNYFGLTDTVFTFSGDCGLPYIYKHGSEYKMIGIHAMATTSPGSYVSVASCIFQEDIDEVSPSPQSTPKECPGCLSDKMRWVEPTKKKDTAEHDLLWNTSCGSSKNNFISFLQDIEKYCTENKYEYNTYIGKSCKGTVPDHLHVHRYTLDKMKERRTRALEDDWFSLSFDNYFHLVHYITHQMTWAEEFRIVFSFLPNGKIYTEFYLYEYSVDMAISPKKNLQQSKFGWQSFEINIPKVSKGIWNFTEGGTFMSNLWNVESPRVTPLCKVPSQSYKSFKTKYVKTPYSRFVSLENKKKPFNPNCQEPHPLKLVSRQGKFNPFLIHLKDITPSPNMAEIDLKVVAYKNLFREKFQMYRNLRKVSDEEVLYGIDKQSDLTNVMSRLEVNTSAGYSLQRNYKVIQKKDILSVDENGIYKWEDNEASRDLQESYEEAKLLIESGTPVFTIFMDTLKDEKLKIQKTYKGRQFSAADFLLILLERKYLGQFLAKAVKYDKEVAVGMDPILDFHELFCRMAKFPNHFTVDFVSWDKKIPAAAYRIFFDLLCDINPQYKKVLSAFSQMYQHTFHVMDDILYAVNGTMASGCVATAPLNSVLNNFLMMIAYIYLCEENSVEPSVKHFNDHIEQISYGDDKWISTDLDWFNMVTVSRIFKEKFGMEMGSSEKGEELTPFVPLDQISLISRYPRKLPSGVYSGALKKITIETFFHWTTSTTKEHLGLLLSLASFESCLWESEYHSAITKEIENLLSKFKYLRSFVYIYDREVVADSVMDMGFIRFLCQLGLSGLIEINTTHRMLRYCHKQTKLIWKNNHITGKFMKMSANVKSYENDLVWLNEWAQKRRMLLKWSHCRLSNETVVDLAICEGAWEKDFGEVEV
ncbi:polyprotein [Kelp fly virus]|uniref:polyprotein n=1 Tax=Kelp fly virus TaxID=340921 RepID=UPI00005D2C0A|nr:polyprotein [Kelp fly virus]AAZ78308.1 polyprotein [Kelp fly virus]